MALVIGSFFNDPFPSTQVQQEALSWLVNDDPANLSAMDTDAEVLLERFIMVLFNLDITWDGGSGWLSGSSVCDWQGIVCKFNDRIGGLELGSYQYMFSFCYRWWIAL